MLLNYSITLITYIVCLPIICYCNPVQHIYSLADSSSDSDLYASGVDFYLSNLPNSTDPLDTSITCIEDLDYKTAFLYFYDADGFNNDTGHLAKSLIDRKIQVEYVITPLIPSMILPSTLINSVLQNLKTNDLSPKFMWMNIINSGEDVESNIDYLAGLRSALQENDIGIGLIAIPEIWDFYYNKWSKPAEENDLLWVDLVLDNFDEFESFGGWDRVSVISPTTVVQCEMKFGNLSYRKDDIDAHFKTNSSVKAINVMIILIVFILSTL
ncbi:unnamed protein product [Auanema sp. JU1783]|nr:unnamed protein product [Auanema sp. JU1783]